MRRFTSNIFDPLLKFDHFCFRIIKVSSKNHQKSRPCALNTVELLKACSSGLGLSPHTAMQIAEKLYTQGYVSYPRTETTAYPESYDLRSVVRTLGNVGDFKDLSHKVLGNFYAPKSGTDKGDHPPLTPTAAASNDKLSHFQAFQSKRSIFQIAIISSRTAGRYTITFVVISLQRSPVIWFIVLPHTSSKLEMNILRLHQIN